MANVHAVTGGPATGVKEERLILHDRLIAGYNTKSPLTHLLVAVKDTGQLAVREEDLATQQTMGLLSSHILKALEQRIINEAGAELSDDLVVVNSLDFAVSANLSANRPGVDVLLASLVDGRLVHRDRGVRLGCHAARNSVAMLVIGYKNCGPEALNAETCEIEESQVCEAGHFYVSDG